MTHSVVFEPGFAVIAGERIPISDAGTHGEVQIGGAGGVILRPLTFGERTRIVMRTAGSPNGVNAVSAAILHAAIVQSGEFDRVSAEVIALALAGADEEAPPFVETALTVAGAAGWGITQIDDAEANELDRFAIYLGAPILASTDDGWTRIVFSGTPASTLDGVRQELVERLMRRADVTPPSTVIVAPDADDNPFEAPTQPNHYDNQFDRRDVIPGVHDGDQIRFGDFPYGVNADGDPSDRRDALQGVRDRDSRTFRLQPYPHPEFGEGASTK